MQSEGRLDMPEPAGRKPRLTDFYRMELALDIAAPKFEKAAQLGKIRRTVELLPDEALQQIGVIGKMIDDLRRGQPVLGGFRLRLAHLASPLIAPARQPRGCLDNFTAAIKNPSKTRAYQRNTESAANPRRRPLKLSREGLD